MLQKKRYRIESIRVPLKRAKTLDRDRMLALAEDILENGQATPICVRADGKSFVLIEGLHRLEAIRTLGDDEIDGYLVRARLH